MISSTQKRKALFKTNFFSDFSYVVGITWNILTHDAGKLMKTLLYNTSQRSVTSLKTKRDAIFGRNVHFNRQSE